MKLRKLILTLLFTFGIFLLCNTKVYAGDLNLRNLEYKVNLNNNGTANVTEVWDISIEDTNTLFKTFDIDDTKYSGITNVSVMETTKGMNKEFSEIYVEKYHVDEDCFYGLVNSKNEFEIAWGVHEDGYARRTFEISYTILDAVKNYADCSEFYWQFLSTSSAIPANKVTGTITLPSKVLNDEDFRVWAHGPLFGTITKTSDNTVTFNIDNLSTHTMLETRVVTPTYVFGRNYNISYKNKLDSILAEEQIWADEANQKREAYIRRQKIIKALTAAFFIITNISGIFVAVALNKKSKKYNNELEDAPNIKPTTPSKYYRDIPNNETTPAQAGFLYYFKKGVFSSYIPQFISATMLDLCMKKYLSFEMIPNNNKDEVKVILSSDANIDLLSKDEKLIYELLSKINPSKQFTMKDFEKYCKSHSSSCRKVFEKIETYVKEEEIKQLNYDTELNKKFIDYTSYLVGYIFLTILSVVFMFAAIIPSIICAVKCSKLCNRYNTLTQKGTDEKEAWTGLKNFMEEFSLLNEREVPELALWEKYLVFATAFGISDKVLKQLKVIYPQISDSEYMNSHGYTYLYYMSSSNLNSNFISSINSSISSAYNYSSGSGSGGGFSGGGGGRRRRWPEWAEDKKSIVLNFIL